MNIGSTEFLEILAKPGRYALLERGAPIGRLKRDFISIKEADGTDIDLRDDRGRRYIPELPRIILDDFLRASFACEAGKGPEHSLIFKLTSDGLKRGRAN